MLLSRSCPRNLAGLSSRITEHYLARSLQTLPVVGMSMQRRTYSDVRDTVLDLCHPLLTHTIDT